MTDFNDASAWLVSQAYGTLSPYKPEPDPYAGDEIPCCKNYMKTPRYVMFFHPKEQRIVFYAFEGQYGRFPPTRISGLEEIPKDRMNTWTKDIWFVDTFAKQEKLI